MIPTKYGEMDEALLEKREGGYDNDNETTTWVEYWLGEECVHRSASVILKRPVESVTGVGGFGG